MTSVLVVFFVHLLKIPLHAISKKALEALRGAQLIKSYYERENKGHM